MTMMNTTKPGVGGLTLSSITVDRGIEHIMDVEKIVVRKHKPHQPSPEDIAVKRRNRKEHAMKVYHQS